VRQRKVELGQPGLVYGRNLGRCGEAVTTYILVSMPDFDPLVWLVADPDRRMGSRIANLHAVTMRKQVRPGIEAEPGRERLRIERDRPWTVSA
jgi:hypothetical protein